jgi:hypothetical protein
MALVFAFAAAFILIFGCASQAPAGNGNAGAQIPAEVNANAKTFSVSDYGVLSYPAERGAVEFSQGTETVNGTQLVKISYASAGNVTIYALLREADGAGAGADGNVRVGANGMQEKGAIVLLPGAGRTKEQEQELAGTLAAMGYATISLDQRGEGESAAVAKSFDDQYMDFQRGAEIFEYQRIYDVLRGGDLMRQLGHGKVAFAGESMGGRYAMMACALSGNGCAGVLGISTSGYGFGQQQDGSMTRFARSIDPDTYAPLVAPRRFAMIHAPSDPIIPLEAARSTYLKAREPRKFAEVECNGTHGWCHAMDSEMETLLNWIYTG